MSCVNKQYSVIQLRRGSQADFVSSNIVLASGEPAYAVDSKLFKIGDGVTPWNSLTTINTSGSYFINSSGNIFTANSGLFTFVSGQSILTDYIQFNTVANPTITQGRIYWNDTEGTVNIGLTANTAIHIGEHSFFRIRNETGSPLYKGQTVYATGVHANGIIHPSKYVADGSINEIRFIGVVLEQVNHNNNGYAIQFGHIEDIDARGNVASDIAVGDETWSVGDILYAHPTVAGKLTNVKPKHAISVAIILDNASNGRIFIRPTNFGDLDDNHDVDLTGISDGKFLQYNSSTGYWVPSSSGNFSELFIGGVSVPDLTYVNGLLAANDAMIFKGTLGSGGTITSLPSSYDTGWTYKVVTAGTYAGNVCEIGDLIIAIVDRPSGGGFNTDWVVAQTNVDGAVSTGGGTTNYLPKFSSSTTLSNSIVYDNGTNVGINQSSPTQRLHVVGSGYFDGGLRVDNLGISNNSISPIGSYDDIAISGSLFGSVTIDSSGSLTLRSDSDHITLKPGSYKDVIVSGDGLRLGDYYSYNDVTITTSGSKDLILNTNGGTDDSAYIRINDGNSGDIQVSGSPNGNIFIGSSGLLSLTSTDGAKIIINDGQYGTVAISGAPFGDVLIDSSGDCILRTLNGNLLLSISGDGSLLAGHNSTVGSLTYAAICGGRDNTIENGGDYSIICGGYYNSISEISGGNDAPAYSFIGGGYSNSIESASTTTSDYSVIVGGYDNYIGTTSNYSIIVGGRDNSIDEDYSAICGGYSNSIDSNYAFIGGGNNNTINMSSNNSFIGGGVDNTITGEVSFIGGGGGSSGENNSISGNGSVVVGGIVNTIDGNYSCIVGGDSNNISDSSNNSIVCCGFINTIDNSDYAAIVCGYDNDIQSGGTYSFIGGGYENSITEYSSNNNAASYSFIGGGYSNSLTNNNSAGNIYYSSIVGGYDNSINNGSNSESASYSIICGGSSNIIYETDYGFIGGGDANDIGDAADYSTICGGKSNLVRTGYYATIPGGYEARTNDRGELAYANGKFTNAGDAQYSMYVLKNTTSGSGWNSLYLDYNTNSDDTITIDNTTATFTINISGRSSSNGDSAGFIIRGCIKKYSGTVSLVGSPIIESFLDSNFATANVQIYTSSGGLTIQVDQGNSGVSGTVYWVATVQMSRVT